jgi:RNA polymerase sigma-70 factor (ECF subfamily)
MDESAILESIEGGDRDALGRLYDRFTPMLYSLALRIVGNAADAEDVIQLTWVQVWRTAGRYEARRGSVASWLASIVRSRALDRTRMAAARARAESAAAPPSRGESPDADEGRRVRAALDALEPKQRVALELAFFEGLAHGEVAARLDAPLGTVKSWIRRGLLRLRDALEGRKP